MCQRSVEMVIGRLVTDEAYRRRFAGDPARALKEMVDSGMELTEVEMGAIERIDADILERLADAVDPRIQKADCCGGGQ